MANLTESYVQITYKNEPQVVQVSQDEVELLFEWIQEVLAEINAEATLSEVKFN